MLPPRGAKTGLIIGVPSVGWQTTLFLKHLMTLVMPLNTVVTYKFTGSQRYGDPVRPVAEADNIILHEAMTEGAQYLLYIEEDVIVPPMAARQLMATMGLHPEISVLAGIVTSKTIPPEPMIYRGDGLGAYWNFRKGEVIPNLSSCHMGCTLIRLADLANLVVPEVEIQDYPTPGEVTKVKEFFRTTSEPDPTGRSHQSQDVFFCNLVRSHGLKVWADATVQCGHFDYQRSMIYGMPQGGPPRQTDAEVVNLGCGLDWDFIDGIRPLRVDLNDVNKPDFRADLRALPHDWTDRFAIVYSSHVLEHFDRYDLPQVFAEMVRVCKPGGEIRLLLPSLDWAIEALVRSNGKLDGRIIDVIWGGRSVPAVGPYPEMYHKMGISQQVIAALAQKHKLGGRTERYGYNQMFRLMKPPIAPEVGEWLNDTDTKTFRRSFIPGCEEVKEPEAISEAAPEGPTAEPIDKHETNDAAMPLVLSKRPGRKERP